jgi:hypothetical protein
MAVAQELTWAAGLFEGEGYIGLRDGKYARMTLGMTDEDVVRRFHLVVGVGSVRGPDLRHNKKPFWWWDLSCNDEVRTLLRKFVPWLGARRTAKALDVLAATPRHRSCHKSKRYPNGLLWQPGGEEK